MQTVKIALGSALLILMLALGACSKKPGDEYLATWVSQSNPEETFTIERNGETFVSYEGDQAIVMTLQGGQLFTDIQGQPVRLTYIEKTEQLEMELTGPLASAAHMLGERTKFTYVKQ